MDGKLIIFSAPSGAGKTTIVRHLLARHGDQLAFSVSATTRQRRSGEVDGRDYHFMSLADFLQKIANEDFLEFEEVYSGTLYGTLRSEVKRIWAEGKSVVFDIDVIGGLKLKSRFPESTLAVFVNPPSLEVLKERLRARGTDSEAKLRERFRKAKRELEYAPEFDVVLNNFDLETACREAEELVLGFL